LVLTLYFFLNVPCATVFWEWNTFLSIAVFFYSQI